MRYLIPLIGLVLISAPAFAGKQCERDAEGDVSCNTTRADAASEPGAIRTTPDDHRTQSRGRGGKKTGDESRKKSGTGVGSKSNQSLEPGIEY